MKDINGKDRPCELCKSFNKGLCDNRGFCRFKSQFVNINETCSFWEKKAVDNGR